MDRQELLGKINYAGYGKSAVTTHDDKPLPAWEDLSFKTKNAWIEGAQSVVRAALAEREEKLNGSQES